MAFSKIFEAFPSPKIIDIPYAGLSISDHHIRCIKFGKKHGGLFIDKYTEKDLPSGVVSSGEINDKTKLIEILKEVKKELNLDHVKVSLSEEKGYLFTAKIPLVHVNEVKSAIESKIEENVPVSPAELTFDYRVMKKREDGRLAVVVSTLPTNVVDVYVEVIKSSGMSMLSLEIESQAIVRALLPADNEETVLIVHFGKGKMGLYVSHDRVVHFSSTIAASSETPNGFDFISHEIKKIQSYWHSLKDNMNNPDRQIDRILICGKNFDESIVSYISSNNQIKTSLGNVWTCVFDLDKNIPEISFSDSLGLCAAVGLALPSKILI